MTMEWNNRDCRFAPNGINGRGSFPEHAECMKWFRRSHADVTMVNGPRCEEPVLPESTRPLPVHPIMETGGSRLPSSTMDWATLIPVLKIARYKLSQN